MKMTCDKCMKVSGGLMLLVGFLFLLQDLAIWNFFGLNWYTAAFLLFGLMKFAGSTCKDCK